MNNVFKFMNTSYRQIIRYTPERKLFCFATGDQLYMSSLSLPLKFRERLKIVSFLGFHILTRSQFSNP